MGEEIRIVRDYLYSDVEISPCFESSVKINDRGCMFYVIHQKPKKESPYLSIRPLQKPDSEPSEPVEVLLRQHLEDAVAGNGKVN